MGVDRVGLRHGLPSGAGGDSCRRIERGPAIVGKGGPELQVLMVDYSDAAVRTAEHPGSVVQRGNRPQPRGQRDRLAVQDLVEVGRT